MNPMAIPIDFYRDRIHPPRLTAARRRIKKSGRGRSLFIVFISKGSAASNYALLLNKEKCFVFSN